MGNFEISNKSGNCFVCGTSTNLIIKNSDLFFCNSNKCINRVYERTERALKGSE